MKTLKTVIIAILASLTTSTLVSCEDANTNVAAEAALTEDGPATRAARLSNIYLAKGWSRHYAVPYNAQTAEENEYLISRAKEHLTASSSAQRALVNELLLRDWEYGVRWSFDDPGKHSDDAVVWAEACMTRTAWNRRGSLTKEADEVIAALIESVLDKELGRELKAMPASSIRKHNALLSDVCGISAGPSTEKLQKVREILNFDWEAGRELQRLVPGRGYKRHELIIMLSEIPMPTDLRAKAVRWVDGL